MFIANLPSLQGDRALLASRRRRLVENDRIRLLGRGRQALAALIRVLGLGEGDEVLLPASLCSEAITPFLAAGADVRYYDIDASLNPDTDDLAAKLGPRSKLVYVVHYYGMRAAIGDTHALCVRAGLPLIEDCALCLFDGENNGGVGRTGDFAVFSPWKFIAVPDGGVLTARRPVLANVPVESDSWTSVARFAAGTAVHAVRQVFPGFAAQGATASEPSPSAAMPVPRRMSALSRHIFERVDFARVRESRLQNYAVLADHVTTLKLGRPLFAAVPEGSIPYSLPIVVQDASALQRKLRALGVASEVSLNNSLPAPGAAAGERCAIVEDLAPRVLSLPVHQSVGPAQLSFIAKALSAVR